MIKVTLFLEVLRIKLCELWECASIEIHFTKKGLRDMLRMRKILEKNNQSRMKIIGFSLTFAHNNSASFQGYVR